MPAPYCALIFDLDGTLVDSYGPICESLNHVRNRFGLPPKTLERVRGEVGRGLEVLMRDNLGAERIEEGVRMFRSHYRKVFLAGTKLMPGVEPTLAELARRRVPMAITSNKPAYFSREIVADLGVGGHFVAVLGPEMVEHPKPDPEMVLKAVELLGRPKHEVLYVGDMSLDVETCRSAGVAACLVPGGSDSREALLAARPDYLIERFDELPGLVRD